MRHSRNCGGKGDSKFKIKVFNEVYDRCPVDMIEGESVSIINLINMSEGEFGMGCPPSKLLDETVFYFTTRSIIKDEQAKMEEMRKSTTHRGR